MLPVTIINWKMEQADLIYKVALSTNWFKSPFGLLVGRDQRWCYSYLDILTRLNIYTYVLHDGDVQLMQNAQDQTFTTSGAH